MVRAAIVTIGDEILIGQIVDTNSAWLGKQLNELGVTVERILSISDKGEDIAFTLKSCIETFDLTLVTGGLGPTNDDITKQILCELFSGEMVQHEASFQKTKEITTRLKLEFNELNRLQSMVPNCCEVIVNNHGTAPGMLFRQNSNILIAMPGVPFEMKEMCTNSVFDIIKNNYILHSNIHHSIVTFGIAESMLAQRIKQWEDNLPKLLHLAYLPSPSGVKLRLSVYDIEDKEHTENMISNEFNKLKAIIPDNFIGSQQSELEVELSEILKHRAETLSVAESCTGGAISSRLTEYDGASLFFLGSVVSYSNELKIKLLEVDVSDIEHYGAVSRQVVEQMARGVRKLIGSDYSIATSGIAGSGGASQDKPVGTVWIAIDTPQGTFSQLHQFTKLRKPNIDYSSSQAIYMLLKHINSL